MAAEVEVADGLMSSFGRIDMVGEDGFDRSNPPKPSMNLTFPQKASVIISTLGPEAGAVMLRSLSEEEVRIFARASSTLDEIPKETVDEVLEEFQEALENDGLAMTPDKLKRLLSGVMSEDQIERLFEDIDESEGRSMWDKLAMAEVSDLSNYLSREHPQTVAVVISKIKPERAAKVMMRLDGEFSNEVVMRMSKLNQLQPSVMEAIKDSIQDEFLSSARQGKSKRRPDEVIGSIMNFMSSDKRQTIMTSIEEQSPQLALAVQRKMFTFGDIPKRVARADIATIVREIDNAVLVQALQAGNIANPETVRYVLENMSRRLAEQLEESMEDNAKPTAKEGEEAQFALIDVVRGLGDRGVIKLNYGEDDDEDEGF